MALRIVIDSDVGGRVGEALSDYFEKTLGPRIQQNARRTVPVDTGDLKDSIVIQVQTGEKPILQVGVDEDIHGVDYARYVEEGTSIQAAQPYLRPAVYQARGI